MKKTFLAFFLLSYHIVIAQLNLGVVGMPYLQQQTSLDPSFISEHRFVIGGDADLGAYNSFGGLKIKSGKVSAVRPADPSVVYTSVNWNLLNMGIRVGKNSFISFSESIKQFNYGSISENGMGMLINGNAPYIGVDVLANPNIQSLSYNELSLGFAHKFGNLQVGARGKYWSGITAISTGTNNELSILTDKDAYQLTLRSDYSLFTAPSYDVNGLLNGDNSLSGFRFRGSGLGLDLGARYNVSSKLSVGASVIDLGNMKWDGLENTSKGKVRYEGFDATKAFTDREDLVFAVNLDTLVNQLKFSATDNVSFKTTLPTTFILTGTYKFGKKLSTTALYSSTSYQKTNMHTIMFNGQYQLFRFLNLGMSYSLRNSASLLGANLTLGSRAVQFFVMTDNIPGIFRPLQTSTLNARMGLNLRFGRMEFN
ncbi:MAG: DUF5723 family protein [Saprospiraceae bacterium]